MHRVDQTQAECFVFSYKEGLFSPFAHDLKICVTRFEIEWDRDSRALSVRFDARSLRVVSAMRDGREITHALTREQKAEIERNITRDVLGAERFPEIRFTASLVEDVATGYRVTGDLALHGRNKKISVEVRKQADALIASAKVHQPDFGIKPFSALLGAVRVRAQVDMSLRMPLSAMP